MSKAVMKRTRVPRGDQVNFRVEPNEAALLDKIAKKIPGESRASIAQRLVVEGLRDSGVDGADLIAEWSSELKVGKRRIYDLKGRIDRAIAQAVREWVEEKDL